MILRQDQGRRGRRTTTGRTRAVRTLAGAAIATGLLGPQLLLAPPASASVPGVEKITQRTFPASFPTQTVTTFCPPGKQLLGAGAEIDGGGGEVVLDAIRPNGGPAEAPTSVSVTASEEDGYLPTWSVTVHAVCAHPVPGLVRIAASSPHGGSPDFRGATATCPSQKTLLGTGFEIGAAPGQIVLDHLRPDGSLAVAPTEVFAGAYEADPDYVPFWSITAYAICADSSAVRGTFRTSNTSPAGSEDSRTQGTRCDNTVMTGMGAEIVGAFGEVVLADLLLTLSVGVVEGIEADPDFAPNWSITAYGICTPL
jgi:hypothetical protein